MKTKIVTCLACLPTTLAAFPAHNKFLSPSTKHILQNYQEKEGALCLSLILALLLSREEYESDLTNGGGAVPPPGPPYFTMGASLASISWREPLKKYARKM